MLELQLKTYTTDFGIEGAEASAVLAAVKAHKDVTFTQTGGGSTGIVTVPYSSVHYVMYGNSLTDEAAEDDNCKVRTPEEETVAPGTLLIKNVDSVDLTISIDLWLANEGTYGGIKFEETEFDGELAIEALKVPIASGATLVIDGLPDDLQYMVYDYTQHFGNVPAIVNVSRRLD